MEPNIFCIARPTLSHDVLMAFLGANSTVWERTPRATPAEELIEITGRICYMSFGHEQSPRSTSQYIRNLIVSGHESVLEHAAWTFIVMGVSRAFTHQVVRHRIGFSFSQLSQQYHDERGAQFVTPIELRGSERATMIWGKHMKASIKAYSDLIEALTNDFRPSAGISSKEYKRSVRSAARSVLPNATETKLAMTANARALRHFFKVRGSIAGDVEMRKVASGLFQIVQADAPAVFQDFRIEYLPDGSPKVAHKLGDVET